MSDTFGGLFLRDAPGAPVKTNRVVVMTMLLVVGSLLGLASIGGADDQVSTAAAAPTGQQHHRPPPAVATQAGTHVSGTTHRNELRSDATVANSPAPTGESEDAVSSEAGALSTSSSSSPSAATPGSSSASDVRRARALLPTEAIGETVSMPYSYAQAWKDPGDLGWRKLSRRAGESCLSCEAAVKAVQRVHDDGSKRYNGTTTTARRLCVAKRSCGTSRAARSMSSRCGRRSRACCGVTAVNAP
jgi:hypothetical protein